MPSQHLPGLEDLNFENRSLFETIRTVCNIVVQGAEQKLLATTATENLAQLLDVPQASPVLWLDKRVDTNNIDFSYYSSLYARTDHFLLHGQF